MLFGLFKQKDHRHYFTKGSKHLAAERYADARVEFMEALKLCPADAVQEQQEIRQGLGAAGNRLAELNIQEGQFSVNGGEMEKAIDHFTLACELAFDESIKAAAREGLRKLQIQAATRQAAPKAAPQAEHHAHGGKSCSSCSGDHHHGAPEEIPALDLCDEERFALLIQPLPGDLPKRYAALGDEFAKAYLLIHDGNDAAAFPILQQLAKAGDNDVVIYELALIMYRSRQVHECEKLLNRSLQLNPENAAAYLAMVHLLSDSGRFAESMVVVRRMMEKEILPDQALIMLGDLQHVTGDQAAALESWSKALSMPPAAKAAAERLVPLLSSQGRTEEAKYLAKTHLKGCC